MSQTAKDSLFVTRLIAELSVKLDSSRIRIQCGNQQTIRHWRLRQEVETGRVGVVYTPSAKLTADGLTKALAKAQFATFVGQLGLELCSSRQPEGQRRGIREAGGFRS